MTQPQDSNVISNTLPPKKRRRAFWIAAGLLAVVLVLVARPIWHVIATASKDVDELEKLPDGFVDDASRMNRTQVSAIWAIPKDREEAEKQLAEVLKKARVEGLKVSIAGARHSMGGHTIYPSGIAIDMLPFNQIIIDKENQRVRVGAGAVWSEIIKALDAERLSVAVMQSNNSFSVGGSLSVNCHGWQFGKPPIASTVESFRLMKANGEIVTCSRSESPELFSLVLGGYGLFGVILDAELRVVPNERYRLEQFIVPTEESLLTFEKTVLDKPDVTMVYARMGIVPGDFLNEVILNVLYRDPPPDGKLPVLSEKGMAAIRRSLFRGSVGSDYGKKLRWEAETLLQPHLSQRHFSRNQLLNEGVETFQNRTKANTDILHEYFVPKTGLVQFIDDLKLIIPAHKADLLNVTVRNVDEDKDTFLRYADQPMFAFVMLFNQPRTETGDKAMQKLTEELIDAALANGGRYYLPYRLHATVEQFEKAYPQADEFLRLKHKYDPDGIFQNQFYRKYLLKAE
jgi:FAD/FMN-containing dehydrogenase